MTTAVVVTCRHKGESDQFDVVLNDPRPDDRAVTEAVVRIIDLAEKAPFGLLKDKVRGEPADPTPSCVDVLARYGITDAHYSVNGGPMTPIKAA